MAAPTNAFTTYDMRGIKESVDNKIYNLSPEETPFASQLRGEQVANRVHSWQEDSYAAANKDNAALEGDDFTGVALTPTTLLANAHQTIRRDIVTTGLSDAVDKYGRGKGEDSEHDYQLEKKVIEVRKDVEAAFMSNNAAVIGSNPTAAKMAGLELYATLASNISHGAGGSTAALTNNTPPAAAPTDGTTRVFTEALLLLVCQGMWNAGGRPKVAYLTMAQKAVVNTFPGVAQRRVDVQPTGMNAVVGVVDIYVWETGPIAFVPVYSDRLRNRTLFITDGQCVKRTYIRQIGRTKLGKTGDSKKTMVLTDVSLKVTNRIGLAKIADLS